MNTEIEDIKARLSVKEVIGGYVQLTKAGTAWKGLCPFHHEKTPSFTVSEERSSWHCFGCNKGGDIFSFVMEMDGLSFPEALALLAERAGVVLEKRGRQFSAFGKEFFNGDVQTEEIGHSTVSKERVFKILDLSSKFFEKQLWEGEGKKRALPYLRGRGLSDESIRLFRLGYAISGWRMLSDFLIGKGFSIDEIEVAGMIIRKQTTDNLQLTTGNNLQRGIGNNLQLTTDNEQRGTGNQELGIKNKELGIRNGEREQGDYRELPLLTTRFLPSIEGRCLVLEAEGFHTRATNRNTDNRNNSQLTYDRFRDRITFPILDVMGRVVGFSARVAPGGDESQAKYINTPETIVYHKSRALYGIFHAKQSLREKNFALLVEGNMDVIAMHQAGFSNTIAISGTALTEEQLRILRRYTETLRLFFDMDSAGQKATRKSVEMALPLGFSVSIVSLPSGKDAAEMAKENIETLRNAVSNPKPAPEYFLTRLLAEYDVKSAEGKRRIAEDFLGLIQRIPQKIEVLHWVHALADRIGVAEKTLLAILTTMKPSVSPSVSSDERISDTSKNTPFLKETSFETLSEKLGRDIAMLLLAVPALLPLPLENATKREFSFIANMPILAFLSGETAETFSFANIPEELKEDAVNLAFSGEKLLNVSGDIGEISLEKARAFFDATWRHLVETLRKEEMREIERAMRVARDHGDKEAEKELALRLREVGRE